MHKRWLRDARDGFCAATEPLVEGDCLAGTSGSFDVAVKDRSWAAAASVCLERCSLCDRCNFVSISTVWGDCSWYNECNLDALGRSVPTFRSGALPRGWHEDPHSIVEAPPRPPRRCEAGLTDHEGSSRVRPVRALQLPGMRCSERYAAVVRCANRTYAFTRNSLGDNHRFETLVRVADAAAPGPPRFSAPAVALPHQLNMSHNAAFVCERGSLHAYGGMARTVRRAKLYGGAPGAGVMHATADALARAPLRWSAPTLVLTGDTAATGCIDELAETCQFDGKLAVVRFKGRVWLYARSNLLRDGGARHVQCASRPVKPGRAGMAWSRFSQIEIEGYRRGEKRNNLYYFSVLRIPSRPNFLAAVFPAAIEGEGGVYWSTSFDGLKWSAPVRLMPSALRDNYRTADHPVDGWLRLLPPPREPQRRRQQKEQQQQQRVLRLSLLVEHDIDLRDYTTLRRETPRAAVRYNDNCVQWPSVCEYEADAPDPLRLGLLGEEVLSTFTFI